LGDIHRSNKQVVTNRVFNFILPKKRLVLHFCCKCVTFDFPGNVYSKNLIESNEEIAMVEQEFKVMFHQIEQLKEEIRDKEHRIVKEFNEQAKLGELW